MLRCGGMLVVTWLAVIGSRPLLNSIRGMRFASGGKPTTLPSLFSYAITREADRATLDIGCWWLKHLRLPIGDRERGWINYSKHWFQTQPRFFCFLFFVLRTAKWQRTVSLWLRTSFCYLEADARRRKRMRSCVKGWVELAKFWQGAATVSVSWDFFLTFMEYKTSSWIFWLNTLKRNTPKKLATPAKLNKRGPPTNMKQKCTHNHISARLASSRDQRF